MALLKKNYCEIMLPKMFSLIKNEGYGDCSMLSHGPDPSSTPILMCLWKTPWSLITENLTSHFFLLAFSFAPSCLYLKSTPNVSTLVAKTTHFSCCIPETFYLFPSFSNRQLEGLFLHLSFQCFPSRFYHLHLLVPTIHEGCDVIHQHPQLYKRVNFCFSTLSVLQRNAQEQATPL